MKFLAINTAGAAVETALYIDGKTVYRRDAEFKKASAVCLPFIDGLLTEAAVTLAELDFIGVVTGPGSFTGIRIGVAAARAFGQFAGLKTVSVTASAVLSYNNTESAECVVTLSDASNGFCYVAAFDAGHNVLLPPSVLDQSAVGPFLDTIDEPCVVCADGFCQTLAAASGKKAAALKTDCSPLIAAVKAAFARDGAADYSTVVPLYVRKSQAETDAEACK